MSAPGTVEAVPHRIVHPVIRAAVVVDQVELYRVGVAAVLDGVGVETSAAFVRTREALASARTSAVELFIVGRSADLKPIDAVRETKRLPSPPLVVVLLDQTDMADVARLVSAGADALLLRTVSADELVSAMRRLGAGERVVTPALAAGTIGRVGPAVDLDPAIARDRSGLSKKELEVLAELSAGLTYREIAASLVIGHATVKTHLVHIYAKLDVRNRQEAVVRALALGLLA